MRILIVEDDDDTAAILEDLLGQEGHTPNVVHTVSEARRQDGGVWDIVISDLGLPDGSGLDVARHFRGLTPRPRLIAPSGYSAETDMSASTVAGFERHLVKPIDLAELRHALQS
jgi:DNA-binding response OmpR family regulator